MGVDLQKKYADLPVSFWELMHLIDFGRDTDYDKVPPLEEALLYVAERTYKRKQGMEIDRFPILNYVTGYNPELSGKDKVAEKWPERAALEAE